MAEVIVDKLSKTFQGSDGQIVRALREASLTASNKELLVLVGPSGSGKTTLLRCIAGLEDAESGSIRIDGIPAISMPPQDRGVAMVFQNHALYPHLNAYENLALGLRLRKVPKPERDRRVKETAGLLGLTELLDRQPKALSGGERQRVAVGRAMVMQPKVFLLDEPLSHLDAPMRAQMRVELKKLQRRLATTMIYVTHDQMEAMALGDRVAVMKEGAIQQLAAPLDLYQRPANLFVASFIGSPSMNLMPGTFVSMGETIGFQEELPHGCEHRRSLTPLALPKEKAVRWKERLGRQVTFGIRPEHLQLSCSADRASGPVNSQKIEIQGEIELVECLGAETWAYLKTASSRCIAKLPLDRLVQTGTRVSLEARLDHAYFFDSQSGQAIE